ncbi:uncharacterized protein [Miscanthus floridulus]|uniref:uncharacterized protein isoform X2 n=1 Tax=Miscanthus floridulus TaxID=154761 RepID=UPI00345AC29C
MGASAALGAGASEQPGRRRHRPGWPRYAGKRAGGHGRGTRAAWPWLAARPPRAWAPSASRRTVAAQVKVARKSEFSHLRRTYSLKYTIFERGGGPGWGEDCCSHEGLIVVKGFGIRRRPLSLSVSKRLVEFASRPMILHQDTTIAPSVGQTESSLHGQFPDRRVADHDKNILLSHGCRQGSHKHISKGWAQNSCAHLNISNCLGKKGTSPHICTAPASCVLADFTKDLLWNK